MAEIAVDAVLLPSDEMMDKAIEANRELLQQCIGFHRQASCGPQGGVPDKIVLDKKNCLPHISLAMGCTDEKDIADIEKVLQAIAKQYSLKQLSVIDIHVGTNSAGEKVSVFRIERTKRLQLLHEEIMRRLAPYFSYDVTADMIFSRFRRKVSCGPRSGVPTPEVGESTLLWIKNYPEKSGFENFFPHITIGYGEIDNYSFPMKFTASKLALCHLGNHCTCRKILASVELRS